MWDRGLNFPLFPLTVESKSYDWGQKKPLLRVNEQCHLYIKGITKVLLSSHYMIPNVRHPYVTTNLLNTRMCVPAKN